MNNRLKIYFIGVCWFIVHLMGSVSSDVVQKYMGLSLPPFEISFFRFLFSAITLLPFIAYYGREALRTTYPFVHIARGFLLCLGITAWVYGLTITQGTTATVMGFSIPLFTLILAIFFLNEHVIWQRWLATLAAFVGIVITLEPQAADFNPQVLIFVLAALSFAMLDIINKKFIVKESMISMLFYSALSTAVLSGISMFTYAKIQAAGLIESIPLLEWQTPTMVELGWLLLLGAIANLILFFILKAFANVDATALAPYRFLELIISASAFYLVFGEVPARNTIFGGIVTIMATIFIIFIERRYLKAKN